MSKLNRYSFIGNLGGDAQVRTINDNQRAVISFSVAISEKWKDAAGNAQEKTTWVKCSIWRKPDQTAIAQYLKQGQMVYVEGEPSARAYIDQASGEAKSSLEVNVRDIQLLGSARPAQPTMGGAPMAPAPRPTQTPAPTPMPTPAPGQVYPEDLPF